MDHAGTGPATGRLAGGGSGVKAPVAGPRLLVVSDNEDRGNWLCHRLEAANPSARVTVLDSVEMRRQMRHPRREDWDLLFAVLDCGGAEDPAGSPGLQWLAKLAIRADTAPVIVIAESGNEMAAVLALRLGAMDYLPSELVSAHRLSVMIDSAESALPITALPPAQTILPVEAPISDSSREPLLAPPRRLLDGRRDLVPGYRLLQKLGESQRATVYLASSDTLGRNVALKVSRGDAEASGFAHEYTTLRALRSPAVIDIHEYGMHEGREYLAMEYFPCGDLRARMLNPITEREALEYMRRIAGALSTVHRCGMLHGDLKPGNLMLRVTGQVVLIDFGLTAPFSDPAQSIVTSMLRGSPYYMSPEHAQGAPLDERSDLYSLGIIY
ncbi:MAG: hypothetical protein RLZZ200_138, partial [Pseudomonadota bacterium]